MATPVPVKTALGVDELRRRTHKLGQRHRTVLFLVDGRRQLAEVLSLAQQAGAATHHFEDLLRLGMVDMPDVLFNARPVAPVQQGLDDASVRSVELGAPAASVDAAEWPPGNPALRAAPGHPAALSAAPDLPDEDSAPPGHGEPVVLTDAVFTEPVLTDAVTLSVPPPPVRTAPVLTDAVTEPVLTDAVDGPVLTDAMDEPVLTDVLDKSVFAGAVSEPILTDAVSEPVLTDALLEPTLNDAVLEAVHAEAMSEPALGPTPSEMTPFDSDAAAVPTETVFAPVLNDAMLGPAFIEDVFTEPTLADVAPQTVATDGVIEPVLVGEIEPGLADFAPEPAPDERATGPELPGATAVPSLSEGESSAASATFIEPRRLDDVVARATPPITAASERQAGDIATTWPWTAPEMVPVAPASTDESRRKVFTAKVRMPKVQAPTSQPPKVEPKFLESHLPEFMSSRIDLPPSSAPARFEDPGLTLRLGGWPTVYQGVTPAAPVPAVASSTAWPPSVERAEAAMAPPAAQEATEQKDETPLLQAVRDLLNDTLRIDAPLFSARIFMRVRSARTTSELIELTWEIQDHLSLKRRSRKEVESLQRARELLGLGNTLVQEESRPPYLDE